MRPQASESAYVAAALPEILLEGEFHDELVELALSDRDLPEANPLERRNVELQRLVFALRACLRTGRYLDTVKLALKAAGETAGESRQIDLIQNNAELASALLAPDRIAELVARRPFGSGWMGAHHAYDAAIMADHPQLAPDAASRLRMAFEWLNSWSRRSSHDHNETVDDEDRTTLAYALLRLRGAAASARFLRQWSYRPDAFISGRALARKLIDLGHFDDVQALGRGARNNVWLLLAVALELRNAGRTLTERPLRRLLRLLGFHRLKLKELETWHDPWSVLQAVTATLETAALTVPHALEDWARILDRHLPQQLPHDLSARFATGKSPLVRAYALRAAFRGGTLDLMDIATDAVRKDLGAAYGHSEEARIFRSETGGLLPWMTLGADIVVGRVPARQLDTRIAAAEAASKKARHFEHREGKAILNEVAVERAALLCRNGFATPNRVDGLQDWVTQTVRTPSTVALTRMAYLFGRTKKCEAACLHFAGQARIGVESLRDDAESQGEGLLALARATFTVSVSEASAYFDRAVEILSRIGDENIPRWETLLHIGSVAETPGKTRPETAYRLSRVAELTYSHVAKDNHFDWDLTVDVIAGLDPASLLTVLSRWRDRRFGEDGRLLPEAMESLVRRGHLAPQDSLALAGISARWNRLRQLEAFVEATTETSLRDIGIRIAFRYFRARAQTRDDLEELRELAARYGYEADALGLPDVLVVEKDFPLAGPKPEEPWRANAKPRPRAFWKAVFHKLDPRSPEDLRTAKTRLRSGEPPWETSTALYAEAFTKAGAGQEDAVISAIAQMPDFSVYDLRELIAAVPPAARTRLSVRRTLKAVFLATCQADPTRVHFDAKYQSRMLDPLGGGISRSEIIDAVLSGFSEGRGLYSAEGLFRLAHFAADKLTPDEADEALLYGLGLLDPLITEEDSDGPWRDFLHPPTDVRAALAGYIWAGLASPIASLRWEHAHVVRALAELGLKDTLGALLEQAAQGRSGPYTDPALPFYNLHARQWLLLGLDRAAVDAATPLSRETTRLAKGWLDTDHVVIRGLAASVILRHDTPDASPLTAGERDRLAGVNRSPFSPVAVSRYGFDADEDGEDPIEEAYVFGMDAGKYMFAPLGRCFGVKLARVEHMAKTRAEAAFGLSDEESWRDDPRHAKGVFDSMETYAGQGMSPKADGLRDYFGYHALMLSAGELLRTKPVRLDPYGEPGDPDEFAQWLGHQGLTRPDGRWVSDRRDPVRLPPLGAAKGHDDRDWRWGVTRARLDAMVRLHEPDLCVWGGWEAGEDSRRETAAVRSAFVSRVGGPSLLATAQLAGDFNVYGLPGADDDVVQGGPLKLSGWISDPSPSKWLDDRDGWAGECLAWPGPRPGQAIVRDHGLVGDIEGRLWRSGHDVAFRAESWADVSGWGRDRVSRPGDRLTVDRGFLKRVLEARGEDLIVAVQIRRSIERPSYARDRDDESIAYPWPYLRVYLVSPDGIRTF